MKNALEIPTLEAFLCPISHEIMTDPVTLADGFTYERTNILFWLEQGRLTSPMTNEQLLDLSLTKNSCLRDALGQFKQLQCEWTVEVSHWRVLGRGSGMRQRRASWMHQLPD